MFGALSQNSGQLRPNSVQCWPVPGRIRVMWGGVKFGRCRAEFGRWSIPGKCWSIPRHGLPTLVDSGETLVEIGRCWPRIGRKLPPIWAHLAGLRRNPTIMSAPSSAKFRNLCCAQFGQESACIPRMCTAIVPNATRRSWFWGVPRRQVLSVGGSDP